MGKYNKIHTNAYSVFDSAEWKAEGIKTIPSNYEGNVNAAEYIRVTFVATGGRTDRVSGQGIANIDIFTASGKGLKATNDIADKLDVYLETKMITINGFSIQFSNSAINYAGLCKDNPSLHRAIYSVPFNYYGVLN